MPIDLLEGEEKKQDSRELTPEESEGVSQEIKMTSPVEDKIKSVEKQKARGFMAFLKRKGIKAEQKKQEPEEEEPKPAAPEGGEPLPDVTSGREKQATPFKKEKKDLAEAAKQGFDISLMPSRLMVIPRTVRSSFLLFVAAITAVVTAFWLVTAYTDWYFEKIAFRVHELQGEIQLLEAKSTFYLETRGEIAALETKAAFVENILNNHIYWTKFFSLLEAYTIPDVYFGDFSADTGGSIHLDVVARDLTSLATQLVSFKTAEDFVAYAEVSGIRKIPTGIAASFDLRLIDDIFYK